MSEQGLKALFELLQHEVDQPPESIETLRREYLGRKAECSEADLIDLAAIGGHSTINISISWTINRWDLERDNPWIENTGAGSKARRRLIHELLELSPEGAEALDKVVAFKDLNRFDGVATFIADDWEDDWDWYPEVEITRGTPLTDSVLAHFQDALGWDPSAVERLKRDSRQVVRTLASPLAPNGAARKGLVIGHVQSGKTANMTAVIARAIDAGYRIILVLSGTSMILRRQTQYRIDRDLIGRVGFAHKPDHEYSSAQDWPAKFRQPSDVENQDHFMRETTARSDFTGSETALAVLKSNPELGFFAPENLNSSRTFVVVTMKNPTRLDYLTQALGRRRDLLAEMPVLVIDDESDLASIDTSAPGPKKKLKDRSATPREISNLLAVLPRHQYIGYTATPFANVLQDPDDEFGLYPRDFIHSLEKPEGYMGASEFHDLDALDLDDLKDPRVSNRAAYVRLFDPTSPNADSSSLQDAIDSFVLSAAIKVYRENVDGVSFPHHTMLIHTAHQVARHDDFSSLVNQVLLDGAYRLRKGKERLESLWNADYLPVSLARPSRYHTGGDVASLPTRFADLHRSIDRAVQRINDGGTPVLIVNGSKKEDPDFSSASTWKILIGGTKLSRGYTVEGLTVSYFRRTAKAADTLLQMGRWFGYRQGYQDLVRLYLSSNETSGRLQVSLYEGLEGACRDEEEFRHQLELYAHQDEEPPEGGRPYLRPIDIQPLVTQHCPWLAPTARNKMHYAEIVSRDFHGQWSEKTIVPIERNTLATNLKLVTDLFEQHRGGTEEISLSAEGIRNGQALAVIVDTDAIVNLFTKYKWADDSKPLALDVDFLSGTSEFEPRIDDWLVMVPKLKKPKKPGWEIEIAGRKIPITYRSRIPEGLRVKAFSTGDHRRFARHLAGIETLPKANEDLRRYANSRRGVLLVYPALDDLAIDDPFGESDGTPIIAGFAALYPGQASGRINVYRAVSATDARDVAADDD
jgi:hypothetical protein